MRPEYAELRRATSAPATAPTTGPAPKPAATRPASPPAVRWPADSDVLDAQRRLSLARDALTDDPYHPRALRDAAAALVRLRRWSAAANLLARLVEQHPDDVGLRFEQAGLLIQSRRWTGAIRALEAIVAQDPAHDRAWFNLAVARQAVGHLSAARRAWDRAIALSPSAAARSRRGEVLLDLHEWAAAAADFEAVLEQEPLAPGATLNLALAYSKTGREEEARQRLLDLLEERPEHVPALNRLAELAWSACELGPPGNPACDEVIDWSRRSLAADPHQPDVAALLEAAQTTP